MTIAPIIFRIKPVLAISIIRIRPVPNTIALGGVATGSMKANEQERVPGIIKNRGLTFIATAMAARIGRRISAVAVLDVSSVKKVIKKQMIKMIKTGERFPRLFNCWPIQLDKPLFLKPVAKAKPPPKSRTIFQGSFTAVFQSIILFPGFFLEGIINSMKAIRIAIVPSLIKFDLGKRLDQPGIVKLPMLILDRNIHKKTRRIKFIRTIFSS